MSRNQQTMRSGCIESERTALITGYPDNHCLVTWYTDDRFAIHYTLHNIPYLMNYNIFPDQQIMQNKPNLVHRRRILNERKLFDNNYIRKNGHFVIGKNKANSKPIQSQFVGRAKMMQSEYLQGIMKKYAVMGYEKTNPIKANIEAQRKSRPLGNHLRRQTQFKPNSKAPKRTKFP